MAYIPRRIKFKYLLLGGVVFLCVFPSMLSLLGHDLGIVNQDSGPLGNMRGILLHTILLWTATCMAFFTFVLAFSHYYVRRDFVTPVIGISLLWGGFIDLFQTLAVDRFIQTNLNISELIPFTWSIGRSFGILILLIGVMILMVRKYRGNERGNTRFFILLALAFGLAAFAVMDYLASSSQLPILLFPDQLISRPWDIIPLFIYGIAGIWVFRKFHHARRDHFSFSVWVSVVPDIVAQIHMAFGSADLFDHSYNTAHILKVVSYAVPAIGLLKDYIETNQRLDQEVHEREKTEQDRRMLVTLVDNTNEMVALIGVNGDLRYCNRAVRENLGLETGNWEGMLFIKLVHRAPGSGYLKQLFNRTILNGHAFGELELVTRDGSRLLPVEYSLFPVMFQGKERHEQGLKKLISQRTAELALVNERMRSELEERKQLETKLVEVQKMEAMGQLSAGIAHEINNPIGYANVNLDMLSKYVEVYGKLLDRYSSLDENPESVQQLIPEVQRMKSDLRYERIRGDIEDLIRDTRSGLMRVIDIVKSLRSFSHPDTVSISELNVQEIMEEALHMVWGQVKRHEIVKEYAQVPIVKGVAVQISQVFVNLLLNAAQAMEKQGTITIKVLNKRNHVMVTVSDTGPGISKENYSRLFDPFFTTKPVGQGTGLGLYISYGIMQKHRGDLLFVSEPGKGATFQVILPVS
jgi:PAS domain S-box-containing protein